MRNTLIKLRTKGSWQLFRRFFDYSVFHFLGKALAAFSSLLLVRLLSVEEYGNYTLILGAYMFVCTFSDMGATETLTFFRWRAGKKTKSWAPYFYAVLRLRKAIFFVGFFAASAYVFSTANRLGTPTPTILIGIMLLGTAGWLSIHTGIIVYMLKLNLQFRAAYAVELSNEIAKVLSVCLIWALAAGSSATGMLSICIGAGISMMIAKKNDALINTKSAFPQTALQSRRTDRILISQITPTLLGSVHFSLQGVLSIWLAAHFGQVSTVAEVGALGRLGVLISVVAGFTGTVFVPQLVAISDERLFLRKYLEWWGVISAIGIAILVAVFAFSSAFLSLLGPAYTTLHRELLIIAATAVIGTWGGYAWSVSRARGWIKNHKYSVPLTIAVQVTMVNTMNLATTQGIMLFGLITLSVGFLYQLATNALGLYRLRGSRNGL